MRATSPSFSACLRKDQASRERGGRGEPSEIISERSCCDVDASCLENLQIWCAGRPGGIASPAESPGWYGLVYRRNVDAPQQALAFRAAYRLAVGVAFAGGKYCVS